MPDLFVPLDVNFQDDDKLLAVSAAAELVYIRAMALSKRLLSDGFIAKPHLRRLCDKLDDRPEDIAGELVDAGLLAPTSPPIAPLDGGYQIVSWLKHNKAADEVREASENGRRGSLMRWHREGKHDSEWAEECPLCQKSSPLASPPSSPLDSPPIASRDIVETETEGKPAPETGTNGTHRWDADWNQVLGAIRAGSNRPIPDDLPERAQEAVRRIGGLRHLGSLDEKSAKFTFRDAWKEVV